MDLRDAVARDVVARDVVARVVAERRSVRGFRPDPVPPEALARIFETAQRAPSWCNIQPWRVWVATGPARERLVSALVGAFEAGKPPAPDFAFPGEYPEPYGTHRKECGKALYEAMGVARGDSAGRLDAWRRNFLAFEAPAIAVCGIDRRFGLYGALDVGCWLQTVMLAATAEGLATCAQAALASYPDETRKVLPVPPEVALLFGIAIGWEDERVAANGCRTTRSALGDNVTFVDT